MSERRPKEERDACVEELLRRIENNLDPRMAREGTTYHVTLQNHEFDCCYTWEQMTGIVNLCSDIMDELWQINSDGFDLNQLNQLEEANAQRSGERFTFLRPLDVFGAYTTVRLRGLVTQISELTGAEGISYVMFGLPFMLDVVNKVFEQLLIRDGFSDDGIWLTCLFFLTRGAMHMVCTEKG